MTQFAFIILCTLVVTVCNAELKCGIGEVEDNCPSKYKDICPKDENYSQSYEKSSPCAAPACKCRFNYSRANNGTCIPTKKCPAFPCTRDNEEYVSCPAYCPTDDCSQATPDGRCPIFGNILIVLECRPACRCKKGYWRTRGICVPYDQCPKKDNELAPFLPIFY